MAKEQGQFWWIMPWTFRRLGRCFANVWLLHVSVVIILSAIASPISLIASF